MLFTAKLLTILRSVSFNLWCVFFSISLGLCSTRRWLLGFYFFQKSTSFPQHSTAQHITFHSIFKATHTHHCLKPLELFIFLHSFSSFFFIQLPAEDSNQTKPNQTECSAFVSFIISILLIISLCFGQNIVYVYSSSRKLKLTTSKKRNTHEKTLTNQGGKQKMNP